jgi:RNA polymerase sigma-70 factor (ECF subfamily)
VQAARGNGDVRRPTVTAQTFWAYWIENHDRLRRLAIQWMRGDVQEAEDALGDSALRAATKIALESYSVDDVRGWSHRLLFNACMDRHRRRASKRAALTAVQASGAAEALVGCAPGSPESLLAKRRAYETLGTVIEELPEGQRRALLLRCVDGSSYAEIAARGGITEANARKRVQLARASLRRRVHP